jgi:hypothetical protein
MALCAFECAQIVARPFCLDASKRHFRAALRSWRLANPKRCTLRASTICRIAKLTLNLFAKNFLLPCRAVTFDNVIGAKIGMRFRGVITDTDSYIFVERANRYRMSGLQRISNSRSEIINAAIGGHKSSLLQSGSQYDQSKHDGITLPRIAPYQALALAKKH